MLPTLTKLVLSTAAASCLARKHSDLRDEKSPISEEIGLDFTQASVYRDSPPMDVIAAHFM
jgi:hypothetical protein